VQCTLTNQESSPLFDTTGRGQFHAKTINFDANRPVKRVQADGRNAAYRITFLDKDDQEIDCFNPQNEARAGAIGAVKYLE
jgi:hypothetical protein